MGLLFPDEGGSLNVRARQEDALFHRMGCKACPLRTEPGRMEPTGSPHPRVYIIGEAPGKDEIKEGEQFVGESGQLLRPRIPKKWLKDIRWNNTVNSRPPRNRTPERIEVECCRPRWTADIEATKPEAIFGFGNVPLNAITSFSGITLWRGRRMPVKVGSHACWYYPMLHPAWLLRQRRGDARDAGGTFIGSEEERMFCFDLQNAFLDVEEGLPTPVVHDEAKARAGVEIITAPGAEGVRQIKAALEWAAEQPSIGVDYETNCLRPYLKDAKVLTAAVGTLKRSIAFPLRHRQAQFDEHHLQQIEKLWADFLRNSGRKFVHHLTFEMEWSGFMFGEDLLRVSRWEDTASQAAVIDERKGKNKPGCFSLEFLIQQYFGFNLKKLSNVDRKDLDNTPLNTVLSYNAMDSKYHWGLGIKQEKVIKALGLESVYELSLRRVPTVVLSQLRGAPIDPEETVRLQKKYGARVKKILADIQKVPVVQTYAQTKGREYVPTSNPDTLEVFTKYLKRRECTIVDKFSKKPKLSCDESVLEKIDHPLAPLLISLRKAARNKSTYIDVLDATAANTVIMPDGLVHCVYNTYWAETGRLSCEQPNLQNFPKRDGEAQEVRRQIRARPGEMFLSLDLGQIEARVIAMFTQDKAYCKALWENYDVHMEWAERIARAYPERIGGKKMLEGFRLIKDLKNKSLPEVKAVKDFRTDIKNQWTFPLFFGAQLSSAADYLNIPENKLRPEYNAFWRQFEGVKAWQEEQMKFYREYGYVECLTGRRRHGPLSANKIYNTPVQGTAAELIMDRMCYMSELDDPELQPELQIHDDLSFLRVKENRADFVAEKILGVMLDLRHFEWINVPITVELSSGKNWAPYDEKNNPDGLQAIGTFSSNEWFK